jgi:hypothetical protein
LLRAVPADDFSDNIRHVELRTGKIYSEPLLPNAWMFGAWSLYACGSLNHQRELLVEFDLLRHSQIG